MQRFHCQQSLAIERPVLYPYKNEEICSDGIVYNIRNSFCVYITIRITSACDSQVNGSYVMS